MSPIASVGVECIQIEQYIMSIVIDIVLFREVNCTISWIKPLFFSFITLLNLPFLVQDAESLELNLVFPAYSAMYIVFILTQEKFLFY